MYIIAIVFSYLLGSISSAIIVCKLLGLPDPRSTGSKNPGATNVLRLGGKKAAIITLIGDTLKGVIPVLLAKAYGFNPLILSMVSFAAILGHLYPIFFKFKGGKGVATAFGCVIALSLPVGIALLLTWIVVAILFRYSSLASLICSLVCPIYMWYFTNGYYVVLAILIGILLIYRHRQNIYNLYEGKERKIGQKSVN